MTIYYLLFCFLFLSGHFYKKYPSKKNYLIFLYVNGFLFLFVASIRYAIGFDYFAYEKIFSSISKLSFSEIFQTYHREFGFYILNKLISMAGGGYITFLFLCNTIITFSVFYCIYRYSTIPWMSIFLYLSLQFFAQSMNLLRQFLAASLFLFCIFPLIKRKPLLYVGIVLVASLFHITAIMMLPFYFILPSSISLRKILLYIVLFIVTYFFFDTVFLFLAPYFIKDYVGYIDSIYWGRNSFRYAIIPICYFLFTLYGSYTLDKNRENNILINSGFFAAFLSFFITKHFIIERLSLYFFLFSILLIPKVVLFKKQQSSQYKMKILYILVLIIGFSYFLFASSEGFHHVYPYFSIFDRINLSVIFINSV